MSATILTFTGGKKSKEEKKSSLILSLYGDTEIEAVIICLNVFSNFDEKINLYNVVDVDSTIAIECLKKGKDSLLFSDDFKKMLEDIINNAHF